MLLGPHTPVFYFFVENVFERNFLYLEIFVYELWDLFVDFCEGRPQIRGLPLGRVVLLVFGGRIKLCVLLNQQLINRLVRLLRFVLEIVGGARSSLPVIDYAQNIAVLVFVVHKVKLEM